MNKNSIIKSACRMCHGVCQVNVHLENDKVVKITGDKESPTSKGYICPKGAASPELLYHPDRITHPLRRVGKPGENKWERISWEEAFKEITDKLSSIKQESGPEFFGLMHGTSRPYSDFAARFANAYGTPNYTNVGHICYTPRVMASAYTIGSAQVPVADVYEFGKKKPACVMMWGSNITGVGAVHGLSGGVFQSALNSAEKVIVIDPRKINPVKKADHWLQLRPGTDGALALAMIQIIINEKIYDHDFVNNFTTGFDRLAAHTKPFTPEWASGITGIKRDDIMAAARTYATTAPACIQWGNAIDMSTSSFHTARSLMILKAITGNLDTPGGNVLWVPPENVKMKSPFVNKEMSGMLHLPLDKFSRILDGKNTKNPGPLKSLLLKTLNRVKDRFYTRINEKSSRKSMPDQLRMMNKLKKPIYPVSPIVNLPLFWESIVSEKPYQLRGLWILGSNPLVNSTNSLLVEEALKKLEFLVVSEMFKTPTAEYANIILPASMWLEQDDVVNNMKQWCVIARKKAAQVGETKDDREVILEIAKRLGLKKAFPWENYHHFLEYMLEDTGMNFDEFCEKGILTGTMEYEKYKTKGFNTASGKVELYSGALEELGVSPLPLYREPPVSPVSTPELYKEYPLVLTTGAKSIYFFHSEGRQIPSLRKKNPEPAIEINPETARNLNIKDNEMVWIETTEGRIQMRTKFFDGIAKNVISAPHAWWFPEEEPPGYGWKRSSINLLFGKTEKDPDNGSEPLRSTLCKVYPAR
ncbi:MAG: molybdopterin-dependent oxidoreductase [bacterium]|nr:molybdopterin-dependent oxidoreductase [bacterium]